MTIQFLKIYAISRNRTKLQDFCSYNQRKTLHNNLTKRSLSKQETLRMQPMHLQSLGKVINMGQYNVQITDEALADMEQLYNYIVYVLLSPENAMKK